MTTRTLTVLAAVVLATLLLLPAAALAQTYPPEYPPSPSPSPSPTETAQPGGAADGESLPDTGGPLAPALALGMLAAGGAGVAFLRRRS